MSCIIIYKNNQPVGVQDENGNPSKLFEQILSNPHVSSFEEAVGIYQNIYSDNISLTERTGKQNTEFFTGKAKKASSDIKYEPVLNVDQTTPVAKAYNLYTAGGNFTGHISKMIAGFQEKQKQVAEAIVKGGFKSFLDIGTSEGGMIKTVASQNKDVIAVGVDPNIEMLKNFNSTPDVPNAEYRLEAFQGSWTEDDGTVIKEFKTNQKFDVVNEDFAFQFINNNRAKQVAGVKALMNENGIFITSEKFHTANEAANESKKYDHQRKYFNADQLTEDKQTIVSGMADDMVNDVEYFNILKDNFKYVVEFWNAGNFKGYLASDSKEVLDKFRQDVGDLSSEFTDYTSLTIEPTPTNTISQVIDKLKETGLAGEVYQLTEAEINNKLSELGVTEGKSVKGYKPTVAGFVYKGDVYINVNKASLDTPIHEFSHLYLNKLKASNETFELFLKGINLAKSKDAKPYQDYVKKTQPTLEVGSIEFYEEVLAQAIGDSGARFLEGKDKQNFLDWIEEVWASLKDLLGLSEYFGNESFKDITFAQFTDAIAKDLLKGNSLEGLANTAPNESKGTVLSYKEGSAFKGSKGISLGEYDVDFIDTTVPVKSLDDVIKEYDGRVMFITSDYTGIGIDKDGDPIEGGAGYTFIKKNVEDNIGFASLDDVTAKSTLTRATNLYGEAQEVAVMVVIQTPSSTLGNSYGAKYLGRGLRTLKETLSEEEYRAVIDSIESVIINNKAIQASIKKFENNPKKGYPIQEPLINLLENVEKYSPQEFADEFSKDTTFDIRRNLVKVLFADNADSKITAATHIAKAALQRAGFTKEDFLSEYGDKSLLTPEVIKNDSGGNIVGGFGITTSRDANQEILATEGRGIKHPLFNGKVPSNGKVFVMDSAYSVSDNFTNFVKPQTIFNEEYRKEIDKLFKEFNKTLSKPVKEYKNLGANQAIKFKEFVAKKNPNFLALRPSTVNSQIAQGLGVEIQDKERAALVRKANGIQFSIKEPNLVYKDSKGDNHETFQEALRATPSGVVSMGVYDSEGFKELASIDANSNVSTKEGLVNDLVKSKILSGESYLDSAGKKVYKVSGFSTARKAINSTMAVDSIRQQLGVKAVKALKNGDIVFDDNHTKRQLMVTTKDGSTEFITPEELSSKTFSELNSKYDDAVALVTLQEFKKGDTVYGEAVDTKLEFIPENELQVRLMGLLKTMGVKTTSIADYVARYSVKNGVHPSARALADLANNIIAFRDGKVEAEDLLEETSHFIISATPEAEKADIKRNIHKTPEWVEYQASYREIYSQTYQGEELEDAVREEILGKVLKNAIAARFQAENDTQSTFFNKVLDFFKSFFTKVESFFTKESENQLDKFTNAVYNNLMNDTLSGMLSGESNKHYTLYSINNNTVGDISQMYANTKELILRLTQQQRELSKKHKSSGSANLLSIAQKQLENLEGEVEELARLNALSNLVLVANSQANILKRVVEKNLKSGNQFSQEENSVYQNFIHKIRPLLSQIDVQLNPKTAQERRIKEEIRRVLSSVQYLEGQSQSVNLKALENIVERVIKKNSFTAAEAQRYRDEIRKVIEVAQKDTAFLHANLGSLTNAKNAFLNLAGDIIERVQNTERGLYIPKIKEFLNTLESIGFDPQQLKKFIRNGYIANEVDAEKARKADLEDKVESYNSTSPEELAAEDTVEDMLKNLDSEINTLEKEGKDKDRLSLLTNRKQVYNVAYKDKVRSRKESYFSKEYLDKLNNVYIETDIGKIDKLAIKQEAIDFDKFYRSQVMEIRMAAEKGVLTAVDAEAIKEIENQRLINSNPRDEEGKLKKGLIEYYDTTLGKYLLRVDYMAGDDEIKDANRIVGLQYLALLNQKFYSEQPGLNGIPDKFLEELDKLETEKEKWDFIQLNSYLGFDDTFWESFTRPSITERLRAEGHDDLVEEIREQQQIIANILKQRRVFNNPSETNANEMNQLEKDAIRNAQSVLENKFSAARALLGKEEGADVDIVAESKTNEAYKQTLADENITTLDGELNFILRNVTPSNASSISTARSIAEKLKRGESVKLNKVYFKVFEGATTESDIDLALQNFAKSKLLPYYKRTEPIGYSDRLASFKQAVEDNVEGTIRDLVLGKSTTMTDLKVSPSFSFFEKNEGINPVWLANRDAKRPQHSKEWLDRVRDDKFYSEYGIDVNTRERVGNSNQKDWEAREALLDLQDWSLENYKMTGVHDRFLLPQQRKSAVRRGIKGVKFTVGDMVGWREDELEYGQDINGEMSKKGSTLLTIPVYGTKKIEDQNDVTDELLESYAWFAQQSALHRARKENIGDMLVLNDLISNSTYENKEATATNTYKMFKSFMDANFYGVREGFSHEITFLGKRMDVAKIAKTFNSWVKFSSLSGITVPMTSLVTGRVAGFVEKQVGEVVNPMAYKKAHSEFMKLAGDAAAEIGGFRSHAKLNVVLEAIGVYNTNERFQNSNYNKALRTGLKTSSGLNELGNFPVSAPLGLSVIYDYKYYNNDIVTFDQFKQHNPTLDAKQAKEEWEKLNDFYDDWVVKDGVLTFKKDNIRNHISVNNLDELIDLKVEAIAARTAALLARTDARVPEHQRSVAARDARATFFLTFLNWFTINSQLKLKDRHYNLAEQKWQEGSWRSTINFLEKIVMNPKDIKKVWDESMADEVTRTNLKRTVIELGVANALAIAAMLLAQYADDEEDPSFLLSWSAYMLDRLAVEQTSSTIALPRQLSEMIENPIISAQKLKDLASIGDVFSSEEVQKGAFSGETERMRFFRKNLPFVKDYARFKDLETARHTYEYFNVEQSDLFNDYTWGSWFFDDEEQN